MLFASVAELLMSGASLFYSSIPFSILIEPAEEQMIRDMIKILKALNPTQRPIACYSVALSK